MNKKIKVRHALLLLDMRSATAALLLLLIPHYAHGHGQITWPPARNNGSLELAGSCENHACFWFTQPTSIHTAPILNDKAHRTFNVDTVGGPHDWSAAMPWRSPGNAPVYGSGCGIAGGSTLTNMSGNGGVPPPGIAQGADFLTLAPTAPTILRRGATAEVAFGMMTNHGGGYSWRLCAKDAAGGGVSEACFARNTLRFAEHTTSKIRYGTILQWGSRAVIPDVAIPRVVWTSPTSGAEWARNPLPACAFCNASTHASCLAPERTWSEQQHCSQACSGFNITHCPANLLQFEEAASSLSGFYPRAKCSSSAPNGLSGFRFNIVDEVVIPTSFAAGEYLLSWRWDCEQSKQVWQNCADVRLV